MTAFRIVVLIYGVTLLLIVMRSLRRSHMRVEYSAIWLCAAASMIGVGVFPDILLFLSVRLAVDPATAFLLFSTILFSVLIFENSLALSRLKEDNVLLAQRIAILEHRLNEMDRSRASQR